MTRHLHSGQDGYYQRLVKKWIISGNLAIWTVPVLWKVLFESFLVPHEINSRFCSKTQWQMFVLDSGRHVGAHPDTYQHGVSMQISINLDKTFSPHIVHKKTCCDLNPGVRVCIVTFFLFSDSGLYLLNGFDFILIFWMAWHWKTAIRLCAGISPHNIAPGDLTINSAILKRLWSAFCNFVGLFRQMARQQGDQGAKRNFISLSFYPFIFWVGI